MSIFRPYPAFPYFSIGQDSSTFVEYSESVSRTKIFGNEHLAALNKNKGNRSKACADVASTRTILDVASTNPLHQYLEGFASEGIHTGVLQTLFLNRSFPQSHAPLQSLEIGASAGNSSVLRGGFAADWGRLYVMKFDQKFRQATWIKVRTIAGFHHLLCQVKTQFPCRHTSVSPSTPHPRSLALGS